MVERGVGDWQVNKARTAVQVITKILRDGEWHRYHELRDKTGLSSATLSKHLKELERGVVEKKILLKSGEYPYPVFYRIRERYQTVFRIFNILDARRLGKKTETNKKKLAEAMQAYMELINKALSDSAKVALEIYAVERNFEAFQQSLDSFWGAYREAAQAFQETVDRFDDATKMPAQVEEISRISKELSLRVDEVRKDTKDSTPAKRLAEKAG
jgi:DNA-binding HxlR family transcriptional regulator